MKHLVRLIVLVITIGVIILTINLGKTPSRPTDVVYTSYKVQTADNLWKIAERTNKFEMSTSEYVDWLKELNEIHTDFIQDGDSIIIVLPVINTLPTT